MCADFQIFQVAHTHFLPRFLSLTQILSMVCVRQRLYFIVTGLHYKKEKKKDVGVVVRDVVVCVLLLLYVCVRENSLLHTHVQQQQHTRTTTTHTTTTTRTTTPIWLIHVRQELYLVSFFPFFLCIYCARQECYRDRTT